jgi:hypothetical protein
MACARTSWSVRAVASRVNFQTSRAALAPSSSATRFMPTPSPGMTCPPARPDAPQAMRSASSSSTR